MQFTGKKALVTGAGGGMGLAVAGDLISRGIDVFMVDAKPEPDGIAAGPGIHSYLSTDLATEQGVSDAVAAAVEFLGQINYFVNTVGVLWRGRDRSAVDMDLDVWDAVFDINLKLDVMLCRKVVPEMKRVGGGSIVHFSSIDALRGDPVPQDAYGASKAALIRLSKSLAIQFAADGIRSNVVVPGPALTPMQQRWEDDTESRDRVARAIPLGRLGESTDMAAACVFLLSDNASYITGTELVVDGGLTALP
jgi:3-oxoacyl-[acyl-carrier protein] reductase